MTSEVVYLTYVRPESDTTSKSSYRSQIEYRRKTDVKDLAKMESINITEKAAWYALWFTSYKRYFWDSHKPYLIFILMSNYIDGTEIREDTTGCLKVGYLPKNRKEYCEATVEGINLGEYHYHRHFKGKLWKDPLAPMNVEMTVIYAKCFKREVGWWFQN